jgi:N-acetyl-alpha-D-glucosaminyl L-malate synthase BshA
MNIGIVCYPTYGGSGVVATELGIALGERGHKVHFITYTQPARIDTFCENLFYHEVTFTDYPLFDHAPYVLALASKMVDVVLHENLDLLHVHYAIPHAAAANMAKQILETKGVKIPVITTLHGTDITLVGKDPSYQPVVEFSINQSDVVTTVSESLKQDTLGSFDINREIDLIPNFIDLEKPQRSKKDHFKTAICPNGEKLLVHISNFRKVKRVDLVVKVFNEVRKKIPSKLLLIGDGPERQDIEKLCRELGTCDDIRFLGKLTAIDEVLSISDVFLMPSESESFGLAALEAMACEVPVVSSNIGGIPEVNIHGITGLLSDVGDVDTMVKNTLEILEEKNHSRYKKAAYERAKEFDINLILPQYLSLYERVLS